jgi:hypothetical protein
MITDLEFDAVLDSSLRPASRETQNGDQQIYATSGNASPVADDLLPAMRFTSVEIPCYEPRPC